MQKQPKIRFDRMADQLIRLAVDISNVQDKAAGQPPDTVCQTRHQALLALDAAIKTVALLLKL